MTTIIAIYQRERLLLHRIYDIKPNEGYITNGTSHGINQYSTAKNIIIFYDAGGGNSYRHHIFKKKVLELAKTIGKQIIVIIRSMHLSEIL